jgi:hypothetical protein
MKIPMSLFRLSILAIFFLCAGCSPILAQRGDKFYVKPTATEKIVVPEVTQAEKPQKKITLVSGASLSDIQPGEPQGISQVIHDQTCANTASSKRAAGGDEYSDGRFERPFDRDMNYLPALDIARGMLVRSENGWNYFTIILEAPPASPPAVYGIELDLNIDGRGDYLIQISAPLTDEWAESGIKMWWDSDGDVGGQVINRSDPRGNKGSGFESLKIDAAAGKNAGQIWSRLIDSGLQIAIADKWVGGKDGKFTWKPYTDGNPFSPSQYDLNDYYLLAEAGTPLIGERDYPLKVVHSMDNTCRGLSGLTPSGAEQGVCPP